MACGGGGGSSDNPPAPPPPPPPPPPPVGVQCTDPTPAVSSTVMFAAPSASAASSVGVSTNGTSACFVGTTVHGAKSNVAITAGPNSFFYFEAQRSTFDGVAIGVSESADTVPPTGSTFLPRKDTLVITRGDIQIVGADGVAQTVSAGGGEVFGFAVDYRAPYPIVNVIGPASVSPACAPLTGSAPCVLLRWQLAVPTATLHIYAYGSGDGTTGPRATINTGSNLATKPFSYSTPAVMAALRAQRLQGDRDLNAQWPGPGGPAVQPVLARAGHERAVIRKGDLTPHRTSLAVTATDTANGTISWRDETDAALGSGASLPLNAALVDSWSAGEHVLTASVVNPSTGRYAQVSFRVLILDTMVINNDDDGDGLTYDQEKALGTDPGNADTDGDGLSDGAEAGLLKNPTTADNPNPGNLPLRGVLVNEPGVTSRGVIVTDDALSAILTDELNPACEQHEGIFSDPVYTSPYGASERCEKRAVRANVGVAQGEFRYFESHRLAAAPQNVGQGIITPGGMIDPYCCFVDPSEPSYPYTGTPPSLAINSVGGVFRNLNYYGGTFSPQDFDLGVSDYYGFAVDYTGADPVVYLVVKDAGGNMTVSDGIVVTGFAGSPAMPMLYGHIISNTVPSLTLNLGLQKFHYDPSTVRAALAAKSVDVTNFVPGVGLHRWQ